MLNRIVNSKNFGVWIIVHVLVGIGSSFTPLIFGAWFFIFAITSIGYVNSRGTIDVKRINLLYLITYLASTELISRMGRGWTYKIPWELGKYTMIFGFLFGILALNSRKGLQGAAMVFLMLPSIFFGPETNEDTAELVANIFGPIALGFGVLYCKDLKVTKENLKMLLKLVLLPCVSVLSFTLIRNPDFSDYEFTLGANFSTAGGFGSNQVSTLLGLGLYISFIFWVNKWPLFKNPKLTLLLVAGFGIQGLLTFSRGGMIGAVIGIIVISYVYTRAGMSARSLFKVPKISGFVVGSAIALVAIFAIANEITGGLLELRYKGETNATLRGTQEVDINVLTTNRYDIFVADLIIWQEYFVFGAGVGGSEFLRSSAGFDYGGRGVAAHVELSRLLSEHGLLGLVYFIFLLGIGVSVFRVKGDPKQRAVLLSMYTLALYTTFHAATRTFVTPLLISLSTVKVVDILEPD